MRRNALADRVDGLLMVGFEGTTPEDVPADLIAGAAGCILFSRNAVNAVQTRALIEAIRAASSSGAPIIAVDQEGGPVARLPFVTRTPSAMALGAADDPALTERVYRVIGDEMAALGFNLDLAPVADINDTPRNQVIGVRSFGGVSQHVARHVEAAIRGLHGASVGATVKHFPGHGSTDRDSHRELPVIALETQASAARSLAPFAAAIRAGVDAVLTAHAAYPSLDADGGPATLSRTIVTGLLREQLAFEGVILSDAMEMHAISLTRTPGEAAIAALQAGIDLLLYENAETAREARTALRQAVADGSLDSEPIERSLERAGRLRARLERSSTPSSEPESLGSQAHRSVAGEAARRAITIVRDPGGYLPLKLSDAQRLFVANFGGGERSSSKQSTSFSKLLARGPARVIEQIREKNPAGHEYKQLLMAAGSADAIVAVARDLAANPLQARAVADLAILRKPMIAVVASTPYEADLLPPEVTVVATYGDGEQMLAAAAEAIAGQVAASGKLPVALTAGGVGSGVA